MTAVRSPPRATREVREAPVDPSETTKSYFSTADGLCGSHTIHLPRDAQRTQSFAPHADKLGYSCGVTRGDRGGAKGW